MFRFVAAFCRSAPRVLLAHRRLLYITAIVTGPPAEFLAADEAPDRQHDSNQKCFHACSDNA